MFTLVCLGDSITYERDEPKYPTYWQILLNQKFGSGTVKVISTGVNGDTAQGGYYRLDRDVLSHQPDLVTVMFGHNDAHYLTSVDVFTDYLRKIIHSLTQRHLSHLWLLTPNQIDHYYIAKQYLPYLTAIKTVTLEKNCHLVDLWHVFKHQDLSRIFTYTLEFTSQPEPDYLHPNTLGHRLIARVLMKHFLKPIKL